MNKLVYKQSLIVALFIYGCALALFSDSANITDLFPSTTTIHFDEVLAPPISTPGNTEAVPGLQDYCQQSNHDNSFMPHRVAPARFVMLDQDSPSEAAASAISSESIGALTLTNETRYCEILSHENLYLDYCTLLL